MPTKIFMLILTIFLLKNKISGQNDSIKFFEIIKGDSVKIFFNQRFNLVEKKCSDFIRYTRVTTEGDFNGYFEDKNHNNILLGKGYYRKGIKQGYFELYHPNGKISCQGNYQNNNPIGKWEYFYENGLPERTIVITEEDTLLLKFNDESGNLLVNEGSGEFNGYVAANSNSASVLAMGKVENGKPDGKWTSTYLKNTVFCKEEFDHGKFIRGIFPNSRFNGNKQYHDKSFLNTFFLGNYLDYLEEFSFEKCTDPTIHNFPQYNFDMQNFSSDLRIKIDRVIENDFRMGKTEYYQIGDNYLTIKFKINSKGEAEDFTLVTPWGNQFFDSITTSIKMQTKFNPNNQYMYFHLKLNLPGGATYGYNFRFSRNISFY